MYIEKDKQKANFVRNYENKKSVRFWKKASTNLEFYNQQNYPPKVKKK